MPLSRIDNCYARYFYNIRTQPTELPYILFRSSNTECRDGGQLIPLISYLHNYPHAIG